MRTRYSGCTERPTHFVRHALVQLLDQAAKGEFTDVIVAEIWRLGRAPVANLRTVDALDRAGVTVHVATGILTGPVLDDCVRGSMYELSIADARRIDGDAETEKDDRPFD